MSDPHPPASPDVPVPPTTPAANPSYPGAPSGAPTTPSSSSPYGAPGYPAPAYGVPASAPQLPKTVAIIALVLAGVGLVMAFVPFVTWFAGLPLLAAFIMGIVALANKKQGGKGLAIAAVAVSVVGWIVSIIFSIGSFGILGQTAIDNAQREEVSNGASTDEEGSTAAEEPADTRQDLELVETAFGQSKYDSSTWWYVAIVDNPNQDYIFSLSGIDVEALDSTGTILDSSSDYRTVLSGRTAIVGQVFSIGEGQIAELSVRGPVATDATKAPSSTTGSFEIAGLTPTTDDYSTTVRGTVTSTFSDDQELVQVVVVARNAAGTIIGADAGYIDRLPTGGTAQFEVRFFDPLPGDTTYEAYAIL
jgi:hypothetical protein